MENRFFENRWLDVLTNPEGWQVVSSRFAPEREPLCAMVDRDITLHRHAHAEALFVLDGHGEYGTQGHMYPCESGSVFLMDSFQEHQNNYHDLFIDANHLWVFIFEDYILYRLVSICQGSAALAGLWTHIIPTDNGASSCIPIDKELPDGYRRMVTYSHLMSLVSSIVSEGYSVPTVDNGTSFQQQMIATIRNHIYETAGNGASLETLAMMSGYSKFHFLRLFQQHTGVSLRHYINHSRLDRVAQMQKEGCYKKEIAIALGFSSLSAYSRWHKGVCNRDGINAD